MRAERARAWDDLFRNNIALILRAQSAAAAGDRDALAADLRDLAERAPELRDNAAYTRDLLAALPPADAAKAQSLAREYRAALLAELRARAGDDREALAALVTRERVEAFGRELRRAYERTLLADSAEFEALLETLDLTPEQQATVRRAVTDYAQKNILNTATPEDRAKLVQTLRETLTHSQWRTLLNQRFGANN
ncbi:MAG: hypothetical protein EA379_12040 [Phycisphaerales bacterium]|nr:MAG: hypothetical protein EA379_12040 [Phycisphaerales bacterium]